MCTFYSFVCNKLYERLKMLTTLTNPVGNMLPLNAKKMSCDSKPQTFLYIYDRENDFIPSSLTSPSSLRVCSAAAPPLHQGLQTASPESGSWRTAPLSQDASCTSGTCPMCLLEEGVATWEVPDQRGKLSKCWSIICFKSIFFLILSVTKMYFNILLIDD